MSGVVSSFSTYWLSTTARAAAYARDRSVSRSPLPVVARTRDPSSPPVNADSSTTVTATPVVRLRIDTSILAEALARPELRLFSFLRFLAEHPRDADAEDVERHHRCGPDRLVDRIARRCHDGRNVEGDEDGVADVLEHPAPRDDAEARQEKHHNGHLKHEPKTQQHPDVERRRFLDRREEKDVLVLVAREEPKHAREREMVREPCPCRKERRRAHRERQDDFLLARVETRRNKQPHLREHERRRDQKAD